jgi:hypothetical protein
MPTEPGSPGTLLFQGQHSYTNEFNASCSSLHFRKNISGRTIKYQIIMLKKVQGEWTNCGLFVCFIFASLNAMMHWSPATYQRRKTTITMVGSAAAAAASNVPLWQNEERDSG